MSYKINFIIIVFFNNSKYAIRILNCYEYFMQSYFFFYKVYFFKFIFFRLIEERVPFLVSRNAVCEKTPSPNKITKNSAATNPQPKILPI